MTLMSLHAALYKCNAGGKGVSSNLLWRHSLCYILSQQLQGPALESWVHCARVSPCGCAGVRNTLVVLQKQAGVISDDNVPERLATGTGPHPVTILRKPEAHLVATAAGLLSQAQPQRLAPMLCEQIEQSADGRWGKAYDPADVG